MTFRYGGSYLSNKPIICQLCDFFPEVPGTFIDALLSLAEHCREKIQIETLHIFPEEARERRWLAKFDNEGFQYRFVPRKRNIILDLKSILDGYRPVVIHSHFDTFDISAAFLKMFFYRELRVIWHLHSIPKLTVEQRLKDIIKVRALGCKFTDRVIVDGHGIAATAIERGFPRQRV